VINNRTNYAIWALCELAQSEDYFSTAEAIAQAQGISKKLLPQILSDLSRSGFVRSIRGFGGGVRLSRPPEKINLLEILEAVQSNIFMYDYLLEPMGYQHGSDDKLMKVYKKVQEAMKTEFARVSLSDLKPKPKAKRKNVR
jgi:Rrf2 family protein